MGEVKLLRGKMINIDEKCGIRTEIYERSTKVTTRIRLHTHFEISKEKIEISALHEGINYQIGNRVLFACRYFLTDRLEVADFANRVSSITSRLRRESEEKKMLLPGERFSFTLGVKDGLSTSEFHQKLGYMGKIYVLLINCLRNPILFSEIELKMGGKERIVTGANMLYLEGKHEVVHMKKEEGEERENMLYMATMNK